MDEPLLPHENPGRDWGWPREALPRLPGEVLRKLAASYARRRSRPDGPSPSDRPAGHTERPVATAA